MKQYRLVDIRRGKAEQGRAHIIYAHLVDGDNQTCVSATLDYILEVYGGKISNYDDAFVVVVGILKKAIA